MPSTYGPVAVNHLTGVLEYAADQVTQSELDTHASRHALIGADKVQPKNFKTILRSAGSLTINSATFVELSSALDLTIPAAVGDVIEANVSGLASNEAFIGRLDAATIVSAAVVNYFSTGTGTSAGAGVSGVATWRMTASAFVQLAGSAWYTLQSGDISGGNVTVSLRMLSEGGARAVFANTSFPFQWSLTNLGPSAA